MRINTKGHMVFSSEREAINYASNAGFYVNQAVATRPDMSSKFSLTKLARGTLPAEYMWYRGTPEPSL